MHGVPTMGTFLKDTLALVHEHYCQVGWEYSAGEDGDMVFESECTHHLDVGVKIIHRVYFHPSLDQGTIIVSVRSAYRTTFPVRITLRQINEFHLGSVVPGNVALLEDEEWQFLQLNQIQGFSVPKRRRKAVYTPEAEQRRIDRFTRTLAQFVDGAMGNASDFIDVIAREFYRPYFRRERLPDLESTIPLCGPGGIWTN